MGWHKILWVILINLSSLLLTLYLYSTPLNKQQFRKELHNSGHHAKKYLVDNHGCRIENIEIFSPEIRELVYRILPISCTDKSLLTFVSRHGNLVKLNINKTALQEYSYFMIKCCYVTVKRDIDGSNPDDNLIFSECIPLENSVVIKEDVVKVYCWNFYYTVYENVHAILKPPERVRNINDPNVLLIGIDGVSSSNFIRTMPKTSRHLKEGGWINLKGYNKVEDNTFPNIIAVLAGIRFSYHEVTKTDVCNPWNTEKLNRCNFAWKMFKTINYSTAYGEDTPMIGTFNSNKAGFVSPPTDYYFRPYFLAAEQLSRKYLCLKAHCTGPEKTGTRMQNLVVNFLDVINGRTPGFGLFWMNTFSHEDLNCPSSMDYDFKIFFENMKKLGHMENTIMVFFSDHGFRFGKIRLTHTGWLEERLPFIYIWIPEKFRKSYVAEYQNLLENTERLTTPYDLFMTLQHLISLSNPNFIQQPAQGCPQCQSLFKKIRPDRTCKDAGIPDHYCTCSNYVNLNKDTKHAEDIATFFIAELNKLIRSYESESSQCAAFALVKITLVKLLVIKPRLKENYLIGIETNPKANFEATVQIVYQGNTTSMTLKEVNRLDRYAPTSYCVKGSLQMFCYCKSILKQLTNIFCNNKYCFL